MGSIKIKLPEDFLEQLSGLESRTDEIVEKCLEAGADVIFRRVKSNLQAVIGRGIKGPSESTGELARALGISPPKLDRNGNMNVKIGFGEPRSGGKSNAMLANILEYGKHGQLPKPFLKPAVSASKEAAITAMRQTLESEVHKL